MNTAVITKLQEQALAAKRGPSIDETLAALAELIRKWERGAKEAGK